MSTIAVRPEDEIVAICKQAETSTYVIFNAECCGGNRLGRALRANPALLKIFLYTQDLARNNITDLLIHLETSGTLNNIDVESSLGTDVLSDNEIAIVNAVFAALGRNSASGLTDLQCRIVGPMEEFGLQCQQEALQAAVQLKRLVVRECCEMNLALANVLNNGGLSLLESVTTKVDDNSAQTILALVNHPVLSNLDLFVRDEGHDHWPTTSESLVRLFESPTPLRAFQVDDFTVETVISEELAQAMSSSSDLEEFVLKSLLDPQSAFRLGAAFGRSTQLKTVQFSNVSPAAMHQFVQGLHTSRPTNSPIKSLGFYPWHSTYGDLSLQTVVDDFCTLLHCLPGLEGYHLIGNGDIPIPPLSPRSKAAIRAHRSLNLVWFGWDFEDVNDTKLLKYVPLRNKVLPKALSIERVIPILTDTYHDDFDLSIIFDVLKSRDDPLRLRRP